MDKRKKTILVFCPSFLVLCCDRNVTIEVVFMNRYCHSSIKATRLSCFIQLVFTLWFHRILWFRKWQVWTEIVHDKGDNLPCIYLHIWDMNYFGDTKLKALMPNERMLSPFVALKSSIIMSEGKNIVVTKRRVLTEVKNWFLIDRCARSIIVSSDLWQ